MPGAWVGAQTEAAFDDYYGGRPANDGLILRFVPDDIMRGLELRKGTMDLVINDIAIAGVSGEVLTNIGMRLKRESPFNRTIMVTHCNGSSGYIADDAAYNQVSYEIQTTRMKQGCAEEAVVNGLLELMGPMF